MTPDFGEHPTSHLMRSVWRLQRQAGRVRAVCLSRSPPDGSANRRHIASTCERWVELGGMDYREAAAAINGLHVQLLVDLNGHCGRHALLTVAIPTMAIVRLTHSGYTHCGYTHYGYTHSASYGRPQLELLSLRPAPLQMTYMGHPGTSGAAYIQYVAVDPLVAPPRLARHFSEKLLQLPQWHVTDYRDAHAFTTLGTPPDSAPPVGPRLPWPAGASRALTEARVGGTQQWREGGLPPGAFVMATFNQLYKAGPHF